MGLRRTYVYHDQGKTITQSCSTLWRCPVCTQPARGSGTTCLNCRLWTHNTFRCSNASRHTYGGGLALLCVKCAEEAVGGP